MSQTEKKPGRVYGIGPNKAGERFGGGYRFFTHTGAKLPVVFRVEFDEDADEGLATVWLHVCAALRLDPADGKSFPPEPLFDPTTNTPHVVTVRCWVRAVPRGEADPPHTPDAVLWRQPGGAIVRLEQDPLPDEAVAELNRLGREAAVAHA